MIQQKWRSRSLAIKDLRRLAQEVLPHSVFEFIDGGAEDEVTLKDNRAAFERARITQRVLVDVSAPQINTEILGQTAASPFIVAPMGSCVLAWPQADLAIARAAAAMGIPYTLSTMATTDLRKLAEQVPGRLWFQLYVLKNKDFTDKLVDRAREADYEALVVTLDLPAGGKRERDLRNGISVPLRLTPRSVLDVVQHPRWAYRMIRGGFPQFENVRGLLADKSAGLTIAARVGQNLDAAYTWSDLARLRDRWPRKLLVKGVASAEDATRLVGMGVDGIWVSNHGGRQLDGAVASFDALPAIAAAVDGAVPIILDSGISRGVDALKAVAMGAQAVAVGRAALFGAAVAGQDGALHALQILVNELILSMKLSGVGSVHELDTSILFHSSMQRG